MASRHVPETRDPTASGTLDILGALLAALGLGGTTYALIQAPEDRLRAGGRDRRRGRRASLIAFLVVERRSRNPMMPLGSSPRGSSAPRTS